MKRIIEDSKIKGKITKNGNKLVRLYTLQELDFTSIVESYIRENISNYLILK